MEASWGKNNDPLLSGLSFRIERKKPEKKIPEQTFTRLTHSKLKSLRNQNSLSEIPVDRNIEGDLKKESQEGKERKKEKNYERKINRERVREKER